MIQKRLSYTCRDTGTTSVDKLLNVQDLLVDEGWMIEGWVPLGETLYSNADHELREDVAEQLRRQPNAYAPHYAWDFMGCVWVRDGHWYEQVFRYRRSEGRYTDTDLGTLIDRVNSIYGYG